MSARAARRLADMQAEWRELDRRIAALDDEFATRARTDPAARRLATIPGIGVLNATALVAGRTPDHRTLRPERRTRSGPSQEACSPPSPLTNAPTTSPTPGMDLSKWKMR
jgi:transposase